MQEEKNPFEQFGFESDSKEKNPFEQFGFDGQDRPVKERGLLGDIGTNIARGAADTAELAGYAIKTVGADTAGQWLIDKGVAAQESDLLSADKNEQEGGDGYVRTGIMSGLRSAVPSLTAGLGGAAAGAKLGAAIGMAVPVPSLTAGLGAAGGLIGGALGALGLFGAGIYGKEKQRAIDQGLDADSAHRHGMEQAMVEGGIEALATPIELMTSGFGGKAVTQPIKNTIKQLIRTPGKQLLANYAKTAGVETATEMLQSGLGNELATKYGLNESSTPDAVIDSIIPALTMSLLFGVGSHAYTAQQQRKLRQEIANGKADPQERAKAANTIWHGINEYDPELAEQWRSAAQQSIQDGTDIDIDGDFADFAAQRRTSEQPLSAETESSQGQPVFNDLGSEEAPPAPAGTISKIAATVAISPVAATQEQQVTEQTPQPAAPVLEQASYVPGQSAIPVEQKTFTPVGRPSTAEESAAVLSGDMTDAMLQADRTALAKEAPGIAYSFPDVEMPITQRRDDSRDVFLRQPFPIDEGLKEVSKAYGPAVSREIRSARKMGTLLSISDAIKYAELRKKKDYETVQASPDLSEDTLELLPALEKMREEVLGGQVSEAYTNKEGDTTPAGSSYPEWIKQDTIKKYNKNKDEKISLDRDSFIWMINRVKVGLPLRGREKEVWEYVKSVAREKLASDPAAAADAEYKKLSSDGFRLESPREIAAGELKPGDEVVVDSNGFPDKLTHKGYDEKGNAILQDGATLSVDPFERLSIIAEKRKGQAAENESAIFDMARQIRQTTKQSDIDRIAAEIEPFFASNPQYEPYRKLIEGAVVDGQKAITDVRSAAQPRLAISEPDPGAVDEDIQRRAALNYAKQSNQADRRSGKFFGQAVANPEVPAADMAEYAGRAASRGAAGTAYSMASPAEDRIAAPTPEQSGVSSPDIIYHKDDTAEPSPSKSQATRALTQRGLTESPEVIPAREAGLDIGGFIGRKKQQNADTNAAPSASGEALPVAANRRGEVGGKIAAGEIVTTVSGRETTPFPKTDIGSNRKAVNTIKRIDYWLMDNAIAEARSRGDKYNLRQFEANRDKPSTADKDSAELYLFGDNQPAVPRPFLKDITPSPQQQPPQITDRSPGASTSAVPQPIPASNLPGDGSVSQKASDEYTREELSTVQVTIHGLLPNGKQGSYQVSADKALADVDAEIDLYKKILDCVKK